MEELTESLATSFAVSNDPNSTAAPHPRFSEYKKKVSNSDQEGRRRNILEQQKSRRLDFANLARRLVDDVWDDADDDLIENEEEDMDATDTAGKKTYKPGRYYRNQLMLSEWLVEVPTDFEEEWLMVTCPWGKRCLIVSARGTTTAYGRNGYRVNSFPSYLPGGNRKQSGSYKDDAILDCIFDEVQKTFYVLDVMSWKGHPVYDSETDFRFFWMVSKMQEIPETAEVTSANPYKFIPLQYHQCKRETLKQVFDTTKEQFDGCLFYHKRAHYIFGTSPLVVWLKPYMVPEMIGVDVPERMLQQKPANYSTYAAHLEHVKETKERYAAEKKQRHVDKKGKRGPDRSAQFKMELSQSKWFTGKPEKFETDWVTVVCPVGQRCQVLAIDGETKCFNKKCFKLPGYFLSILPGGNGYEYGFGPTVETLLDCVYVEEMYTYFILDCILWGGRDLKGLSFSERTAFLRKEMLRKPEFKEILDLNMAKFVPLYHYETGLVGLDQALRQTTFEIDGILFYKKDSNYVSGETDTVLWTKPYILPDVFEEIAVPKHLMEQKPESYKDFETFVDDVQHGRIKEKKKKKKSKEFVPKVNLNLPPQASTGRDVYESKKGGKQNRKPMPWSYYGPGEGFKIVYKDGREMKYREYKEKQEERGRGGRGRGRGGQSHRGYGQDYRGGRQGGGSGDSYGRILAKAGEDARVYGKGSRSGYPYYGDEWDLYHTGVGGRYPEERMIRGSHAGHRHADPYGLADLDAALPSYDGRNNRGGRKAYRLF